MRSLPDYNKICYSRQKYYIMRDIVFISYSNKDKEIILPLFNELKEKVGDYFWLDWRGIEGGSSFEDVIIEVIDKSDIMLFMLSDNSLNSHWTRREVYYAESQNKRIVPIVIDDKGLRGWFKFHFGTVDYINVSKDKDKLFANLRDWLCCEKSEIELFPLEPSIIPQLENEFNNCGYINVDKRDLRILYDKDDIRYLILPIPNGREDIGPAIDKLVDNLKKFNSQYHDTMLVSLHLRDINTVTFNDLAHLNKVEVLFDCVKFAVVQHFRQEIFVVLC